MFSPILGEIAAMMSQGNDPSQLLLEYAYQELKL